MRLSDILKSTASRMRTDFENVTAHLGSSVDKGAAREDAVRQFVGAYLPPRLGAERGELADSGGQLTGELDLVVFDRDAAPPLYSSPSVKVFPCEAARAVIEIKSRLSVATLREDAEKIRRAKSLRRQFPEPWQRFRLKGFERDEWPPLLGGIFAFKSSAKLGRLGDEMQEWNGAREERERLDFVAVLDQGIVACGRDDIERPGIFYPAAECGLTMFEQKQSPEIVLLLLTTYVYWRIQEFDAFGGHTLSLIFGRYLSQASTDFSAPTG